jgi:dTMP kinase
MGTKEKLIVCEGCDCAGKSTQIDLIKKYFEEKQYKYTFIHFPTYEKNEAGKVISAYLRGEYGNINDVDPIFVANMYAMNRFLFLPQLQKHLIDDDVVLLDRYVFSNMAYQGAKYTNDTQSQIIREWIDEFEFGFLELPYPDLNIFFDIPIECIEDRLKNKREGEDRVYLDGKPDIHEIDIEFQKRVRENYLALKNYQGFEIIDCTEKSRINNEEYFILNPETLFEKYKNLLDKLMLIKK